MSDDPLSDILRMTEAQSVMSGGIAAGGKWSLHIPPSGMIVFAAIIAGSCWMRLDGYKKAVRLHQGDVGLLPGRKGFVVCSSLAARPMQLTQKDNWGYIRKIGDGSGCTWLAGKVALHPSNAFLLTEALPAMVHVRASSPAAAGLRRIVEELVEEQTSPLPGASVVSAQLAQLFFVKILRAHLAGASVVPRGWLGAVGDARLLPALRMMHRDPARDLGLSDLAKAAGMSRTRFAVHFKSVTGAAPLAYLTEWRMRVAQRMLREENATIHELAASLGYSSESAFSHAFKRITGVAPRTYRVSSRS